MILVLNGSPSGQKSNCDVLIKKLTRKMKRHSVWQKTGAIKTIHLSEQTWSTGSQKKIYADLNQADGFIFVTGTYWDSWGSPLQTFLENVTELEGSATFMGKPAIVLVLNHSVGGKGVLSRLQGVLSTIGCLIPPMSGLVYSWVSEQVVKNNNTKNAQKDLWSLEDLDIILENFKKVLEIEIDWMCWPVDKNDFRKVWLR